MTVYMIGSDEHRHVKLGYTSGVVEKRLKGLRTGSPVALRVLWQCDGDQQLERRLHRAFKGQRRSGEWFDLGDSPVQAVLAALSDLPDDPPRKPSRKEAQARRQEALLSDPSMHWELESRLNDKGMEEQGSCLRDLDGACRCLEVGGLREHGSPISTESLVEPPRGGIRTDLIWSLWDPVSRRSVNFYPPWDERAKRKRAALHPARPQPKPNMRSGC